MNDYQDHNIFSIFDDTTLFVIVLIILLFLFYKFIVFIIARHKLNIKYKMEELEKKDKLYK